MNKVQHKLFSESHYEFVIKMVEWNSLVSDEEQRKKLEKITINGGIEQVRGIMNETVVDILFYLSKPFRERILKKIADEANKYFNELYQDGNNPRFMGKVSIVGHSLGTVITYDLLSRQFILPKNFDRNHNYDEDTPENMEILKQ